MNLGAADGISAKRQYAGQIIQARHYFGTNLISLDKVEARKDVDEEGLSPHERFARRGNFYADVYAKEGANQHPVMSPTEQEALDHHILVSRAILLAGAELLPLWPKLEFRGLLRFPPPPGSKAPLLELVHDWSQQGSSWRCRVCLRGSRAKSKPLGGTCPGQSRLDQG
eukprot:8308529-Pyramimonas_sp.AAC.1